jgi:hypothetical protein
VIIQGIFAPHLGKVAPLKDGQRFSTGILRNDLDDFYSKVKLYCVFIDVSAKDKQNFLSLLPIFKGIKSKP